MIELQTKTGLDLVGQEAAVYGGSHGTLRPSFSSGGTDGKTDYFVTGSYLQDDLGTDNVTLSRTAIHDQTRQYQEFALLTRELGPGQKLSLIFSGIDASFQIPDAPGLQPGFDDWGTTTFNSARLDRNQDEQNYYGIVAYETGATLSGRGQSSFPRANGPPRPTRLPPPTRGQVRFSRPRR